MAGTFLNVGAGYGKVIHETYAGMTEIRVDADPATKPDILADARALPVADGSVDSVLSSHMLEHFPEEEAEGVLREFRRVIRPGGFVTVIVPDFVAACAHVASGLDAEPCYMTRVGNDPIYARDIIFGHRGNAKGNPLMAHRNGYTPTALFDAVTAAGFRVTRVITDRFNLVVIAEAA